MVDYNSSWVANRVIKFGESKYNRFRKIKKQITASGNKFKEHMWPDFTLSEGLSG